MKIKTVYPVNQERLINTFVELASISSPSMHEQKAASFIAKKLKKAGAQVSLLPCGESANLLAVLEGDAGRQPVLFSGHMDTVNPCENIHPVVTETRISSDGTTVLGSDDKAAIAMFIEALEVIKENRLPHGRIEILLTCAEEIGLLGIKGFDMSLLKSKTGFVTDSSGHPGLITVKAPYDYGFTVKVKGRAAHAGMEPEKGINAIVVLANIIASIPNGRLDEETTINVGVINGGSVTNIVTPEAECRLEMRSISLKKINALEKLVRAKAKETADRFKAKLFIEKEVSYTGFSLSDDSPAVQISLRAVKAIGLKPELVSTGGGSDTNILNRKISSVNLACGMSRIHTTNEYIEIKDLIRGGDLILSIIHEA